MTLFLIGVATGAIIGSVPFGWLAFAQNAALNAGERNLPEGFAVVMSLVVAMVFWTVAIALFLF